MGQLYLPSLSHWQNRNIWSGSLGRGNYYISPQPEAEGQPPRLLAQVWSGPLCRELAAVEQQRHFPLSAAGLDELARWLEEEMAARQ